MSNLPNIKFNIAKDGLGQLQADIKKLPALVITGVTVTGTDKVTIGKSNQIFSLAEAVRLGIEPTGANAFAYKHIAAFYEKALTGAELWFMLTLATTTMEDMADVTKDFAKKLVADAKGKVRFVGLLKKASAGDVIANGLDADVDKAVVKGQALAEYFEKLYFPIRVLISGNNFDGTVANLKDYNLSNYNKVAVLIANTDGAKEAAIGMAVGRLANIPVQRKLHRIKDAAVEPFNAYFTNGATAESLTDAWEAINAKGYIFLKSFAGRSGYFFTTDQTLTASNDDFKSLSNGFVMDKAILIAYDSLLEELSDEIPVTVTGTIHPAIIKSWQNKIDAQLRGLMVNKGELSNVKIFIDENQNVLSTSNIAVGISLLPVGYAEFITVNIGFTTKLE